MAFMVSWSGVFSEWQQPSSIQGSNHGNVQANVQDNIHCAFMAWWRIVVSAGA
jgi:hypothetical protein